MLLLCYVQQLITDMVAKINLASNHSNTKSSTHIMHDTETILLTGSKHGILEEQKEGAATGQQKGVLMPTKDTASSKAR